MNHKESSINPNSSIYDENLNQLRIGDIVSLFGMLGEVKFECGAYGIGFSNLIDWDLIESKIPEITGCDNTPAFCYNDNFISFWELLWNFNCEENVCCVIQYISKNLE